MAVLEYTSTILFYYSTNSLVDKARMHSGMVARMINAEGVKPELYTITADETTWFQREMSKIIRNTYDLFHKLSTHLNEGIIVNYNVAAVPEEPTTLTAPATDSGVPSLYVYGFWIKNLEGHYKHSLQVIDGYVEAYIVNALMTAWWLKCGVAEQYKITAGETAIQRQMINNSLYSIYKPKITSVTPVWSVSEVTIETDTSVETVITTSTSTSTTESTANEVLYYDSYSLFPETGTEDTIYVDRSTGAMYIWQDDAYVLNTPADEEYSTLFYDSNYVVVTHNLGIYSPNVTTYDSDGNAFESIYSPIDVNSGICQWNIACSGKIICN